MFIPNKTYHAIKVGILAIVAVLLLVIAGELVLYINLAKSTDKKIMSLVAQLDTLSTTSKNFNKNSLNKHEAASMMISTMENTMTTNVIELRNSIDVAKSTIDILVRNECMVRPYYMDKRLLEMCQ